MKKRFTPDNSGFKTVICLVSAVQNMTKTAYVRGTIILQYPLPLKIGIISHIDVKM